MFKSIRQSMSWLHSWLGLVLGWCMFAIFITGTTAYFKDHINLWAEPKLTQLEHVPPTEAIYSAYQYLQTHADLNATEWNIVPSQTEQPHSQVWWFGGEEGFASALLDPATGDEILLDQEQQLGDFLYRFHFQFYGFDSSLGRLIVSFTAFIMLITLISGIITHKKIFTDFFTFRTFKSQRSWLDFHNISAVIALPFFLTITFTGLMILFYIYLPQGINQLYPQNQLDYFQEIRETSRPTVNTTPQPPQAHDIRPVLSYVQQQWGTQYIANVNIKYPTTDQAIIEFRQATDRSITLDQPILRFQLADVKPLDSNRNRSPIAVLNTSMYGLHLAPFATPLLKTLLFLSGIFGCLMIASGLLLWSLKRQIQRQSQDSLGHYLVDRLNLSTIAGLILAITCSFIAVRLDSLMHIWGIDDIFGFPLINSFFIAWLLSCVINFLVTAKYKLWSIQLFFIALTSLGLFFFDLIYLISMDYVQKISDYWQFFRIDIYFLILGIMAIFCIFNIQPIQEFSHHTLQKKLNKQSTQPTLREQKSDD